jgi:hypothetical protein
MNTETQKRLNEPSFFEGFLAGIDFADARSTPSFQRLWERVMKAEKWTPEDAVNYYVGMNKPGTDSSKTKITESEKQS